MEIARIETQNIVNNTNKPLPDWEHDYTTDFLTKFRPLSFLDDYDPYYINPDYPDIDSDYIEPGPLLG